MAAGGLGAGGRRGRRAGLQGSREKMVRFLTAAFSRKRSAREALSDEQTTPVVCEEFQADQTVSGKKQQLGITHF